jgi:hypothetical protein
LILSINIGGQKIIPGQGKVEWNGAIIPPCPFALGILTKLKEKRKELWPHGLCNKSHIMR